MKLKPIKRAPALIALGVLLFLCLLRLLNLPFLEELEKITYDMRVREAARHQPLVYTNFGFVYINEDSIREVQSGSLGYRYGLYWPRSVYARLVHELALQRARVIAFDVIFGELRPDHTQVQLNDGSYVESDEFLGLQMRHASNVVIAVTRELAPPPLFRTNAVALGDISTQKDSDGVLRRVEAFRTYRKWHSAFLQVEADPEYGIDLSRARVETNQIVLVQATGDEIKVPLDKDGLFSLADFAAVPPGTNPKAKPFTEQRQWHMGIVLAALGMGLDLNKAQVDLPKGTITLRGANGLERAIPVDENGFFYIDWCIPPNSPNLLREGIHDLLRKYRERELGSNAPPENRWAGKLVVVGSSAVSNDLTDRGATPLLADTLLVSKHWNVANSIITGRFVRRSDLRVDMLLIMLMAMLSAFLTLRFRVLVASGCVFGVALLYIAAVVIVYVAQRLWLPVALPIIALGLTHLGLLTWRVMFEQKEQRRVKSVFSKMVSPKIVTELLQAETLSLGGARRQITVLFADVRGFTEFTDVSQEQVAEFVRQNQLSGAAAESAFDNQARETLSTINLYLGLVADTVIKHDGTLDKFIGDCVMAFWGAPTSNPQHALSCVRASIDAQRAIYRLNLSRAAENKRRDLENDSRRATGLPPQPLLPLLQLGSGINTGMATAGLMGSAAETRNYTVFGREVNLASRLESLSGRGRIFISEATYEHLRRDDPSLAETCVALPPVNVKGIRNAVTLYEVPWMPNDENLEPLVLPGSGVPDTTALYRKT